MKKILIIEDDPVVAHIYCSRLEKEGYTVEVATDGQTGYYRIHDLRPDGVLLDLMLPKMNGVEILKKIRAQAQFQKMPVIVFTNAYVSNMIQESFTAGASAVYNKATLTPRQIVDALNTALCVTAPQATEELPAAPVPEPGLSAGPAGDVDFQAGLLRAFMEAAPQTLGDLRKQLQEFTKATEETARLTHLFELYRKIHALTGNAGIAGLRTIAQMASALEALLKELHDKPKNITPSTLRTTTHAVDFLGELFAPDLPADLAEAPPINILVVDDEILSRRAITYALDKAFLKSVSVEDPQAALNLARENSFDLVFLDVQMPGMDGFQLCEKIRVLDTNKSTPVLFVTSLNDFKVRAQSTLSGGSDLIAKPFMFIELTVKSLTFILRNRVLRHKQKN